MDSNLKFDSKGNQFLSDRHVNLGEISSEPFLGSVEIIEQSIID